ncbi:MAG: hypothetical protein WBE85_12960 [Methylocella sp.]
MRSRVWAFLRDESNRAILVLIAGAVGGLWVVFVHFSPTPDAKPPPVHAGEGSLAVGGNVSNSTIINGGTPLNASTVEETSFFAECHYGTMPGVAPAGGRIFGLNVFPTPIANSGGGFIEFFALKPGQEMKWSPSNGILQAYECKITNYGVVAIFNAEIVFKWIFQEAVADKNQVRSGKVTLERDWPCLIPKIDPGVANPFVFYIYNISNQFVYVSLPASISGTPAGKRVAIRFSLTQSSAPPMNLPSLREN